MKVTGKTTNSGIVIGDGGSLNATNVAVGEGASITITADQQTQIAALIAELKSILDDTALGAEEKRAALADVATIERACDVGAEAERSMVVSALNNLERLAKASSALLPLADRLWPAVKGLAQVIL